MSRKLTLPDSPSASDDADGRLFAPAAARNRDALLQVLRQHAPPNGRALEIASGTGEHMAAFAHALPALTWQPSDPDPQRRASINAHCAGVSNVQPALDLDASRPGWAAELGAQDLIVLINLLHLISTPEAERLLDEVARALAPGGVFLLYGPFLRDGETTSEGDARFHASLQQQDPDIGYKDDWDVIEILHKNFLELVQVIEMPANNLCLVSRRPG